MITPRLNSILKNVSGKTLADIGTDHAYIPISLARDGKITHAIACDIVPGPLLSAKRNIEKYGLTDIIELRLGAGLCPLEFGEAESVVCAGMGGEMLINILNDPKSASYSEIILQPMNFQAELRKWLTEHNFTVISEDLASEGFKIYNILKIKPGEGTKFKDEISLHLPDYLFSHPLFPMLFEKKKREFTKILTGLKKAAKKDEELIEKYSFLLKEMDKI